jgi:hypothetical protein
VGRMSSGPDTRDLDDGSTPSIILTSLTAFVCTWFTDRSVSGENPRAHRIRTFNLLIKTPCGSFDELL